MPFREVQLGLLEVRVREAVDTFLAVPTVRGSEDAAIALQSWKQWAVRLSEDRQ